MKKIIPALLLILFVSCTKESVTAPGQGTPAITTAAITYRDNSISVVNFKAQATDKGIEVKFTTLFEKSIVKLEILRGYTDNNLCSIYQQPVTSDSYSALQYGTSDFNDTKVSALYYMIKYTLANGDWGYTPVYKLSL